MNDGYYNELLFEDTEEFDEKRKLEAQIQQLEKQKKKHGAKFYIISFSVLLIGIALMVYACTHGHNQKAFILYTQEYSLALILYCQWAQFWSRKDCDLSKKECDIYVKLMHYS